VSEVVQIEAKKRDLVGTGISRDLRGKKMIPCIIYGDKKDPVPIQVDEKKLRVQINDAGFFSKQCEIKVDESVYKVLPKDIQLHPVNEKILHVDFLRVGQNTTVTLFVPVKFINENSCEGVKQGGVLNIVRHEVEIKTLVSKIPEFLEADLDGLEIGDSIHISSIKLEEGVSPTITDRDFTIATVAPPTVMKVEETVTEEEATDEVSDGSPEKGDDKEAEKKEDSSEDKSK
jgi:large subunit ribosomal protein L25